MLMKKEAQTFDFEGTVFTIRGCAENFGAVNENLLKSQGEQWCTKLHDTLDIWECLCRDRPICRASRNSASKPPAVPLLLRTGYCIFFVTLCLLFLSSWFNHGQILFSLNFTSVFVSKSQFFFTSMNLLQFPFLTLYLLLRYFMNVKQYRRYHLNHSVHKNVKDVSRNSAVAMNTHQFVFYAFNNWSSLAFSFIFLFLSWIYGSFPTDLSTLFVFACAAH